MAGKGNSNYSAEIIVCRAAKNWNWKSAWLTVEVMLDQIFKVTHCLLSCTFVHGVDKNALCR